MEVSDNEKHSSLADMMSCRIFEHFAIQTDPVTEFIKLRSAPFKEGTTLVPKLAGSTFFLEKQLQPLKNQIQ
jgi:hypothetical protein